MKMRWNEDQNEGHVEEEVEAEINGHTTDISDVEMRQHVARMTGCGVRSYRTVIDRTSYSEFSIK
jgi:hypothetical protein